MRIQMHVWLKELLDEHPGWVAENIDITIKKITFYGDSVADLLQWEHEIAELKERNLIMSEYGCEQKSDIVEYKPSTQLDWPRWIRTEELLRNFYLCDDGKISVCGFKSHIYLGNLKTEKLSVILKRNKMYLESLNQYCAAKCQVHGSCDRQKCVTTWGTVIKHYPNEFSIIEYGDPLKAQYVNLLVKAIQSSKNQTPTVTVTGDSMEPTFRAGEKVKINTYIEPEMPIGSVVVYRKVSDHITVHRIIYQGVFEQENIIYYRTKGDNNDFPDPYFITRDDILGIVQDER